MTRTPPERLFEEAAFVAYHFNWDHDTVMSLPHRERQRWCAEISQINERMNEGGEQRVMTDERRTMSGDP